jgi:hypothetical protein
MDYEFYFRLVAKPRVFCYVDQVASINIFDGNISSTESNSGQTAEAVQVTLKNKGDYKGALWCDSLLPKPEESKRPGFLRSLVLRARNESRQ